MRPETSLILDLIAELIGEVTGDVVNDTTHGKVQKGIAAKIKRYQMEWTPWTSADYDILALIAMADLAHEKRIKPLVGKDETALQLALGVNSLSKASTAISLDLMRRNLKWLQTIRKKCDAAPGVATAIVGKSTLLGPANASFVAFNQAGAQHLRNLCDRNKNLIDQIVPKLERVIPVAERTLQLHQRH